MFFLLLGIVLFLGAHTFTTLREQRAAVIGAIGEQPYKGLYSLVALAGFVLIVWGFHNYRAHGWIQLWQPLPIGRVIAIVLMWFAFVALAASGKNPGMIRGWLRHPMLVAVKIWALAHLLVNGDLGGLILFGSFLGWAVYDRIAVKKRGDIGAERIGKFTRADKIALGAGTAAWILMMFLHPWIIGVSVFEQ